MTTTAPPVMNQDSNAAPAAPAAPAQAAGAPQQPQGLPPTGLQQQLASLNQSYQGAQQATGGFDPRQQQFDQAQGAELSSPQMGSSSLDTMARSLAQNYGLAIGRGSLVDEGGNFLTTPDQLAAASGGSMTTGEAAARMGMISDAITQQQNIQQQGKAEAALQTGLGQVQERGRGSLASLQTGLYEGLASLYSNQEFEAADFSYFIQKEQLDIAQDLMRRQEKLAKKQSRGGFLGGIGLGLVGAFSGNLGLAAAGVSQAAGNAGGTGWF